MWRSDTIGTDKQEFITLLRNKIIETRHINEKIKDKIVKEPVPESMGERFKQISRTGYHNGYIAALIDLEVYLTGMLY